MIIHILGKTYNNGVYAKVLGRRDWCKSNGNVSTRKTTTTAFAVAAATKPPIPIVASVLNDKTAAVVSFPATADAPSRALIGGKRKRQRGRSNEETAKN